MNKDKVLAVVLAAVAMGLVSMESKAASTYTLGGTYNTTTKVIGNPSAANPQLETAQGFYAANSGFGSTSSSSWTLASNSQMVSWGTSGWGMNSDGSTSPNHAIDNNGTNTEAVLLSFDESVVLNSVTFGWSNTDADFSVFRYTGTTAPTLAGMTTANFLSAGSGWELVGNYGATASSNAVTTTVNAGGVASSWWLVSAYSNSYNTDSSKNFGGSLYQGNDYFKFYSVAASACTSPTTPGCSPGGGNEVPEPGSLALVSLGLLGLVGGQYRRRRAARGAQA